jgi:hypothetical protein
MYLNVFIILSTRFLSSNPFSRKLMVGLNQEHEVLILAVNFQGLTCMSMSLSLISCMYFG